MRSHHNFLLNHYTIIFAFILAIAASCIEDINLDSEKEMPVVVECVLTRDTVQRMKLYRMRVMSETGNEPIVDASATIKSRSAGGELQTVAEFHRTDGIGWEARFQPEYDTEYMLTISIPGKEDITASTRFPEDLRLMQCEKSSYFSKEIPDNEYYLMHTAEVRIGREEADDETSYTVYREVSEKPCKIWVFPHTDTTYVYPGESARNSKNDADFIFTGSNQPLSEYAVSDHPGADRFNISTKKLADLRYWSRPDKPFEGTAPNYSQWCHYLCPDVPVFKGFVRIDHPANFRNGLEGNDLEKSHQYSKSSFFIAGDYSDSHNSYSTKDPSPITWSTLQSNRSFLNEVHFLSDEYDAYLRELYIRLLGKDDFILSSYDYTNIPSNINGGVGIFGADYTTWDMEEMIDKSLNNGDAEGHRRDG